MKKILFALVFAVVCTFGNAQISTPATPPSSRLALGAALPTFRLPLVAEATILAEDSLTFGAGVPLRFGQDFSVQLNLEKDGVWEVLPSGDRVWRLRIQSKGAKSLNFIFNQFFIPDGGQFFIYNDDKSYLIGAFTERNNQPHGGFSTAPVKGNAVTLELFEPADQIEQSKVEISTIVHAYRDMFATGRAYIQHLDKDFGSSGSCNVDANCPLGAGWYAPIRSVGLILTANGTRWCSGAMVNNTAQDTTPYFLSANHCRDGNEANWVFIFDYQSPTCNGSDGVLTKSISGATLRATDAYSDFLLLELSSRPPDSYLVFYAGWDRRNLPTDTVATVHHPSGDVKKITLNYNLLTNGSGYNPDHWRVSNWEVGTTEGGSSGAPLFNKNGRIIGQLHGGLASCSSNGWDEFGKFSKSWTGGGTPASRLRDWLDPLQANSNVINGSFFIQAPYSHDLSLHSIVPFSDCGVVQAPQLVVQNNGSTVVDSIWVRYQFSGYGVQNHLWTGSLSFLQTAEITLPPVSLPLGNYTFYAQIDISQEQNPSDNLDSTTFSIASNRTAVAVHLQTDSWPEEISYKILNSNNQVVFEVTSNDITGDAFENTLLIEPLCLPVGCYTAQIFDSFGDGLNGGFGGSPGYFSILENTTLLGTVSGNFGSVASIPFCVPHNALPPPPPAVHTQGAENQEFTIQIYPNPTASGKIYFETPTPIRQLIVSNALGQIKNIFPSSPTENFVDLTDLPRGIYFLTFIFDNQIVTRKIIKQ